MKYFVRDHLLEMLFGQDFREGVDDDGAGFGVQIKKLHKSESKGSGLTKVRSGIADKRNARDASIGMILAEGVLKGSSMTSICGFTVSEVANSSVMHMRKSGESVVRLGREIRGPREWCIEEHGHWP